jgi:hypothetical protein
MSVAAWILVGAAIWLVAGVPLALLLGRVVRGRDEQVPTVAAPRSPSDRPASRQGSVPSKT